ncbi:MAG: hypothetical protein EXR21_03015 [Flavobacteriaceae bacterium]|nr:hypothetical protein [Flavobacteriaceae bacterium]
MKKSHLLVFALVAFLVSIGKKREQDSLQTLLKSSKSDTNRVRVLNKICWNNRLENGGMVVRIDARAEAGRRRISS